MASFAFANPRVSTRAAERRRRWARHLHRFAAWVGRTLVAMAYAWADWVASWETWITRCANRLDASATERRRAGATELLARWVDEQEAAGQAPTSGPVRAEEIATIQRGADMPRMRAVCSKCSLRTSAAWLGEPCWRRAVPCDGTFVKEWTTGLERGLS